MLGSQITEFCESDVTLRRHFAGVIGADQVKRLKRDNSRLNCFFVANTDKASKDDKALDCTNY